MITELAKNGSSKIKNLTIETKRKWQNILRGSNEKNLKKIYQ